MKLSAVPAVVSVVVSMLGLFGCAHPKFAPGIPSDLVNYRYSLHRYHRHMFSHTSRTYSSGNYVVTVSTTIEETNFLPGETVTALSDKRLPIKYANLVLLRRMPWVLKRPFVSVDGWRLGVQSPSSGLPPAQ